MKIQYVSDLHLDRYDFEQLRAEDVFARLIVPVGDILLLAGDIGNARLNDGQNSSILRAFFRFVSRHFYHVFFVCGTCEYYRARGMVDTERAIALLCCEFDNVHFLNNDAAECGGIVFVGSTLWSHVLPAQAPAVSCAMEEYAHIDKETPDGIEPITPIDTVRLFRRNIAWLKVTLAKYARRRVVVLTHHAPSLRLMVGAYAELPFADVCCAYASSLEPFLRRYINVEAWVCGRVHVTTEATLYSTRCVVNAAGGPFACFGTAALRVQNAAYDPRKYFVLYS